MSDTVEDILKQKNIVVIATVFNSKSSSFRKNGQMFALTRQNEFIGNYEGEFGVYIKERLLGAKKKTLSFIDTFTQSRSNAADSGGVCGERTKVFFNYIGESPMVIIFGCGDLGKILADIMKSTGYRVLVVDDDESFLKDIDDRFDKKLIDYDIKETYPDIEEKDFCVVLTRGHQRDLKALKVIFSYNPRYIGMIGSARKNEELHEEFIKSGYFEEQWKMIKTPIGLEINALTPGEIAIAIAAEIVDAKNRISQE
ncbi:MAG: XdhC family protein [Thermotogota bacterium]|nr:XdhC family protein [Thermotogota bacterium]